MDPAQFHAPEAGRTVRMPTGYTVFVPAKLPPALRYDAPLVLLLSRADAALSELSGIGRHLPNPHLLIAPYVRREAVLSSRIEGTRATISDLLLQEAAAQPEANPTDVREVRNYIGALEHGMARLHDLPLSLRLVRELHGLLMEGVRGEHATPGEFRRTQNWIGASDDTLDSASYVPPPPVEMLDLLGDWESFLHRRDLMPDLVQCAIMHEQFEAIHPVIDGNGRIGRLLITLFLLERERLSQPLLYLSGYIEAHRQEYYDLLQRTRTDGDWYSWTRFFLQGVYETATSAIAQSRRMMDLRESFRLDLQRQGKALELIDHLFINPYITIAYAAQLLGTSNETARKAMGTLQASGVVREVTGRSWGRLYLADAILEAIQA